MRTVLSIGREPDNDLVINLPVVSGHHARLTWEGVPGQALLEDLGSSNGTALGQLDRKVTRTVVMATDTVFFGNHSVSGADLLGWVDPTLAASLVMQGPEMVIGRDPGCHRVIDRSTISGRHARLRRTGNRLLLEDLGSSNGTYVNDHRVDGPTEVRPGDLITLGAETFRLELGASAAGTQKMTTLRPTSSPSPTLAGRPAATMLVDAPPPGPSGPRTTTSRMPAQGGGMAWVQPVTLVILLLQAPIFGIGIGILALAGVAAPSTLFLLSLAALWFGLSTAVFGLMLDPRRPEPGPSAELGGFWLTRLLVLGGFCVAESLLALLVVLPLGGLQGPALASLGLLILASWVGLAVGFLIVMLAPQPSIAWAGLAVALLALGLFGGGPWSLPRSVLPIRLASNAAPTRWAFEGLLVSESASRPAIRPALAAKKAPGRDLAEDYFPIETDRMGPRADAMALGSMLIGLIGLGCFVVKVSGEYR